MGNYLITKWIGPCFLSPEHNGILDDFQTNDEISNNLMEILKLVKTVFQGNTFPPDDIKSELNDFINQVIPSVNEYFRELVSVNESYIEAIRAGKSHSTSRIRSRSICISIYEISMIAEGIYKQKEEMQTICPEVCGLADNIHYFSKDHNIFGDKKHPVTGKLVKPIQSFVVFHDLVIPDKFIANYLEEFNKMQGFSKDLPEDQKVLYLTSN